MLLANWPLSSIAIAMGSGGAYASSNDINVPVRNLLHSIESVLVNCESQAMAMCVVRYSCNIFSTPIAIATVYKLDLPGR